jgi:thiamine biosynthesis lipoprotein
MLAFSRATGGTFDPAVGGLVRAIRSGGNLDDVAHPTLADALSRRPGEAKLAAGVELDAGGFGKGLALDRMAVALRSLGAEAALLDFGGSSQLGFGAFPGQAPMMLAVGLNDGEMHGIVELGDRALSTSRAPAAAGAGAIVDPRSGEAVTERRLATVAAPTATIAEVWSTALVVLGRPGIAPAVAHGVEVLYEDADGLVVTPGFPLITRERPPR